MRVGLYATQTGVRTRLAGNDDGQRRYMLGNVIVANHGTTLRFEPAPAPISAVSSISELFAPTALFISNATPAAGPARLPAKSRCHYKGARTCTCLEIEQKAAPKTEMGLKFSSLDAFGSSGIKSFQPSSATKIQCAQTSRRSARRRCARFPRETSSWRCCMCTLAAGISGKL
jgi:hypothetical protein